MAEDFSKLITSNWTLRQYALTLNKIKKYACFAVGDFVIEKTLDFYQNHTYRENIKGSGLPARFKIVHRDPTTQLTFAQRVNLNGKMGKPFCLEGRVGSEFILDNNYVTAQLVNDEFDPQKELEAAKEQIKRIKKANKLLFTRFGSAQEVVDFMLANLAIGVQFWTMWSNDQGGSFSGPFTVTKITKRVASRRDWQEEKLINCGVKHNIVIEFTEQGGSRGGMTSAAELFEDSYYTGARMISLTKPQDLKVRE